MKKELNLHISIPFCQRRCAFCTKTLCEHDIDVVHAYALALQKEIRSMEGQFEDYEVKAISIGGGSPAIMAPADLMMVLQTVKDVFHVNDAFISLRMKPGEQSRSLLDRMRDNGVNHYVFSIPTAHQTLHDILERPYDLESVSMVDMAVRSFNIRPLSFSMMYGIPSQTAHQFVTDLNRVLVYEPEHITLQPLQRHKNARLTHRYEETDEMTLTDMYAQARDVLLENGYEQYTPMDFSRNGAKDMYRLSVLEGNEYLGIGYTAQSCIDDVMYRNGHSLKEYLEHPDEFDVLVNMACRLSEEDRERRKKLSDLLLLKTAEIDSASQLVKEGFVQEGKLTVKGMALCHRIEELI